MCIKRGPELQCLDEQDEISIVYKKRARIPTFAGAGGWGGGENKIRIPMLTKIGAEFQSFDG